MRKMAVLSGTVAGVAAVLAAVRRARGPQSPEYAFVMVWAPMVGLGIVSRVVTFRLPAAWHRLRPFERSGRLYEVLGVRAAKAALRRGPLAVFNPKLHLPAEATPEHLASLERRMNEAEASHAILFAATTTAAVRAFAQGNRRTASWMTTWNLVMNGYPVMLQRYNRALLARRFGGEHTDGPAAELSR